MYRAESGHALAKVAGFFLFPAAGGLATLALAPRIAPMLAADPAQGTAAVAAICHAATGLLAYNLSEKSPAAGNAAFFRGAMWGEMFSAPFAAGYALVAEKTPMPAVAGTKFPMADRIFSLITMNAAADVAARKVSSFAPKQLPSTGRR